MCSPCGSKLGLFLPTDSGCGRYGAVGLRWRLINSSASSLAAASIRCSSFSKSNLFNASLTSCDTLRSCFCLSSFLLYSDTTRALEVLLLLTFRVATVEWLPDAIRVFSVPGAECAEGGTGSCTAGLLTVPLRAKDGGRGRAPVGLDGRLLRKSVK